MSTSIGWIDTGSGDSTSAITSRKKPSMPPLVHCEQQFFLARKIEIDGSLRETRLVGDFGDARHALRRAQQDPLRGVEDGVVTLALVFGLNRALANYHGNAPWVRD